MEDLLSYDPVSGVINWKVDRGSARAGSRAGRLHSSGYRTVRVNRRDYYEHVLAWFLYYGSWPTQQVDHLDGDRSNNKISNLENVDARTNVARGHLRHKKSGLPTGVTVTKKGYYQARFKGVYLGIYSTPEEAHQAYLEAIQ